MKNKIKILCVSDAKDPIVYSDKLNERFNDIDLVLSAGDLDLEYYEFIISSLDKPLLFVFGNHNFKSAYFNKKDYEKHYYINNDCQYISNYGAIHIGGKAVKVSNLIIAGLGGCMRYNMGLNQFTETTMFFYMMQLIPKLIYNKIVYGRYLDILLTHAPPKGIHDKDDLCHRGFKVFLWFMDIFRPKYLVHGHIHIYDKNTERITQYKTTKVINAYNHAIIEIEVSGGRKNNNRKSS